MGTPKYFNGRLLFYNPVIPRHYYWSICEHPSNTTWDLSRLTLSPTQSWNSLREFIICCNETGCALQNRMRSWANIRCVSPSCLQFGWNLKSYYSLACFSSLERHFIESTNNSGDRGSPYLKSLPSFKWFTFMPIHMNSKLHWRHTCHHPFGELQWEF